MIALIERVCRGLEVDLKAMPVDELEKLSEALSLIQQAFYTSWQIDDQKTVEYNIANAVKKVDERLEAIEYCDKFYADAQIDRMFGG